MKSIKLINGYAFVKNCRAVCNTNIIFECPVFFKQWIDAGRICRDFADEPVNVLKNQFFYFHYNCF